MMKPHTTPAPRRIAVVIVAAGKGTRAATGGGDTLPKQYRSIAGRPVLARTLEAFARIPGIDRIIVVIGAGDNALFAGLGHTADGCETVIGGATRQQSVLAGLEALAKDTHAPDLVLIHDAARPFVSAEVIARVVEALEHAPAALPVMPVPETVKRLEGGTTVVATIDRSALATAQTPQGFRFADILATHRRAAASSGTQFTDDASIAEWAGLAVRAVAGDGRNFKITTREDFERAETQLSEGNAMQTRTGQGFDVHRFVDGDHVVLGGVRIPHDKALSGHSDADVLLHAIADAIYGALADGDIGSHFPPSDPQWKGADSAIFLRHAVERVQARGGEIRLLDATVLCEEPKIGPVRDAIRTRIAEIAGLPVARVAVKATTTERLGFTGRREGIAAMTLATVALPRED